MRKRNLALTLTTASALVAGILAAPSGAGAAPQAKAAIPHTKPDWTAHAKNVGHANAKAAVTARVYLAPNGGLAALQQAALAVSTPGSATYRQFVSAGQYQAQYGPTAAQVASVESWLKSTGLKVTGLGASNRYVSVSGTVSAAEAAFGSSLNMYSHDGQTDQAPASTLTAPVDVAGNILTVTGLDTATHIASPDLADAPPPAGFRNARPCSTWFGQLTANTQADFTTPLPKFNGKYLPYAPCGYTGPQYRAAYEGATNLDGSGVTVAITDAYAAPTIAKDSNKYASLHGDGSYAPGQFTQADHGAFRNQALCGPSGWYGEETLDVEAVHAMAPAANIRYYGARSCFDNDLLDTLGLVVDENVAQLVTNSWGDIEENETGESIAAYEQVFMQGALQGISFMFSSGDNGDELQNTAIMQTDYPTSDPYVTSVGGTSAAIGQSGAMTYQSGWGTVKYTLSANGTQWNSAGFLYGAGGGTSSLFNQPAYQAGVAPGPYRTVPDTAMDADPNTGMLIGETQTFPTGKAYGEYRIGGTSLASPLFAGMTALTLQGAPRTSNSGPAGLGLLNPLIYANATSGRFTDIKGAPKDAGDVRVDFANGLDASNGLLYSVRTFDQDSSLTTVKGWDNVTGVGTPNNGWLSAASPPA
jgi:subtilase family serine protease